MKNPPAEGGCAYGQNSHYTTTKWLHNVKIAVY